MICWPGWTLWTTSAPMALALTRSMKSRATLKFTSASSNAIRTSRKESLTLASEIFPRPRRLRKAFWSLVLNESNIRLSYRISARIDKADSQFNRTLPHHLKGHRAKAGGIFSQGTLLYGFDFMSEKLPHV